MRLRALLLLVALAALVAFAAPARVSAAGECNGIPRCIPIEGPWVAVPASGEVQFELSCPQGRGVIAGTDALASSQDVHATFDGNLGAPVTFGRTTNSAVLFRAVAGRRRPGWFKPFVGCIPSQNQVQNTLATQASPIGPPLELHSVVVGLNPGVQRTVSVACPAGQFLVDTWTATAFATATPPPAGLREAIELTKRVVGRKLTVAISASEALPLTAGAQVQLGVRCATE